MTFTRELPTWKVKEHGTSYYSVSACPWKWLSQALNSREADSPIRMYAFKSAEVRS